MTVTVTLSSFRDYRAAIAEGLRIAMFFGHTFPNEITEQVNLFKSEEIPWERQDKCSECGGTEFSGPSLVCDNCYISETHFHCLLSPILCAPVGLWICKPCCEVSYY